MVQNHLLQVLSLVAMEPPVSLDAEAIRDEKVKLLRSIRPMPPEDVARQVVRGPVFRRAWWMASRAPATGRKPKVDPDSNVETYVALKLFIDNWRWSGVPFYLRTGKSLPVSASEVRVQFRRTPHVLFAAQCGQQLDANSLTLRLQPNEGISLRFNGKVPGHQPRRCARCGCISATTRSSALTRRKPTSGCCWKPWRATRRCSSAATRWRRPGGSWMRSARPGADKPLTNREFYSAGTWGPVAADDLLAQAGHAWHEPCMRPTANG